MKYKNISLLTKEEIVSNILNGNKDMIIDALLSLFMNVIDKELAIYYAKWAIRSSEPEIKKTGIIGMGHIARVYGIANKDIFADVIDEIESTKNLEYISILNDAKDDMDIFIQKAGLKQ